MAAREHNFHRSSVWAEGSVSQKGKFRAGTLEVTWKTKSGMAGNAEKEAEVLIRRTLDYIVLSSMHPNTGISIVFQVVNDDGALLACAMNAACAALVDAGIPLAWLVAFPGKQTLRIMSEPTVSIRSRILSLLNQFEVHGGWIACSCS